MSKTKTESVAKILVINPLNQALRLTLSEHKVHPKKSFKPDLPGGLVDHGESELNAVIRETMEETGIIIPPANIRLVYTGTKFYEKESKSVSKSLYITHLARTMPVTLSWEHSAYKWIPTEELSIIDLGSFYGEAIKYCLKNDLLS